MRAIAIGVGCRRACSGSAIEAVVALACAGLSLEGARLFSIDAKRNEPGLKAAAMALGLPLTFLTVEQVRPSLAAVATRSSRVEAAVGIPSVAEAAALAGAGEGARLLVPRIAAAGATCAVAACGSVPA